MASIEELNFSNKTLAVDSLPRYEAVEFTAISPKQLHKSNIQVSLWLLIAIVGWGFLWYLEKNELLIIIAGAVIILLFAFLYFNVFQLQKHYGYAVRERDIIYRRGYLITKTTIIPFNRIQHVSTSRGVLDKLLGISKLKIFTAGGQGSDISIPGLEPELSAQLKEAVALKLTHENE